VLDRAAALLFENKLDDAYKMSSSFVVTSRAFHDYTATKISEAERRLFCCEITVQVRDEFRSVPVGNVLYVLLIGSAVFLGVLYFAGGLRSLGEPMNLLRRKRT